MKALMTILSLMLAVATPAIAEVVVQVEPQVSVNSQVLTIGSIAAVSGSDTATVNAVESVRLGFSPMPGSWRELDREIIVSQLQLNGFSTRDVSVQAPRAIKIFRASQTIDGLMLESRLRDYIAANAPWNPSEMSVSNITDPGTIAVPQGDLALEIIPRGTCNFLGPETFTVQVSVNGQKANRVLMTANIRVMRETLVAARTIQARQILGKADVEYRRMDISGTDGDVALTMDEIIGMEARAYISPGQVITRRVVAMPLLVKRGQVVTLTASSDGFEIQTKGVAQQNGHKGDVIRVLNPTSRKTIDALVVGHQAVEVIF